MLFHFFFLQIGDELYTNSKNLLGSNFVHPFLMPYQVSKTVMIDGNEIIFCTDEIKAKFGYLMKNADNSNTKLEDLEDQEADESNMKLVDLAENLHEIFFEFKYCIFVTGDFAISILKSEEGLWILDSHERGNDGLYVEGGKAVLIQFNGVNEVVQHLRQLYGFRNIQYDIVPIDIVFGGDLSDRPGAHSKGDIRGGPSDQSETPKELPVTSRGGPSDQSETAKKSPVISRGSQSDRPGTSKEWPLIVVIIIG